MRDLSDQYPLRNVRKIVRMIVKMNRDRLSLKSLMIVRLRCANVNKVGPFINLLWSSWLLSGCLERPADWTSECGLRQDLKMPCRCMKWLNRLHHDSRDSWNDCEDELSWIRKRLNNSINCVSGPNCGKNNLRAGPRKFEIQRVDERGEGLIEMQV
jgi:hypothetical protein